MIRILIVLLGFWCLISCKPVSIANKVNSFIGTGGYVQAYPGDSVSYDSIRNKPAIYPFGGLTYPGAVVPFGMVHLSPDCNTQGFDWSADYHYCGDDRGGLSNNRSDPDMIDQISTFPLSTECYCDFNQTAAEKAGFDPMEIFFKGMAYRMMWKIYWDIKKDKLELETSNPLAYKLLKVFNLTTDYMYNREILADEKGVIYQLRKTSVLWAFEDFEYQKEGLKSVTDILNNSSLNLNVSGFNASKLTIYQIADV
ncbi:MAG: hypothetical protein GZ094_03605 [Mariniphaga sp.]|nr:hypothetical protein [Mariniphaga sp.]